MYVTCKSSLYTVCHVHAQIVQLYVNIDLVDLSTGVLTSVSATMAAMSTQPLLMCQHNLCQHALIPLMCQPNPC